jgi:beta-glucanase (GH16 family)
MKILFLVVLVSLAHCSFAQQDSLIWSDEFDEPGSPNATKWGYDVGAGGWGNNEAENYTKRTDNAVVSDGTLKIILKKENYQYSLYTSARLLTKGKFSFTYGTIKVRAKLPAGGGTWPAIWMLGNNISSVGWPACGEIDVMEHVGNQLNKIFGTLHYPGHSGGSSEGGSVMNSTATTDFHVYSAYWSPTVINFYVDDALFYSHLNSVDLPFNHNFFIILNVAMGGNFGGAIDPAFTSTEMEVDYVRVYQPITTSVSNLPSINDQTDSDGITVSPNPSKGLFKVNLPAGKTAKGYVANITGKEVFQFQTKNEETTLDLTSFAKGLYFVTLQTDKKTITRKIIIK